jgi:hypothetical protein
MMVGILQIGRLALGGPPAPLVEPVGDPVANVGGAVVPAPRTAPQFQIALATYVSSTTTVAQRQALRRQLRSLLNNSELKHQAFLYIAYVDDPEQNGWYVPDATTLAAVESAAWKTLGLWQTGSGNWLLAGHQRTHREARQVWMKDLRTGSYARDTLGWIASMDFSALPALQLSVLAHEVSQATVTASGAVVSGPSLPMGRDGGVCQVIEGLPDLATVAYERPESALNISDVVVYDRRGAGDAPAAGAGAAWEEVFGPDYPWNWLQ